MPSPDILHDFSATSFGGIACAQFFIDFILWENVLNDNPQLRGIVELGSWEGGFSWFLWAQTQVREMSFHTYDIVVPEREPPNFRKLDIYRYPDSVEIGDEPIALFCDGGNKPRELATFPQMCAPGSVFLVHDWGTETLPSDVPDTLREVYGGWCDTVGSITRVFRMKDE